jgi:hypothetical protein
MTTTHLPGEIIMRKLSVGLLAAIGLFACAVQAQVTNVPPTELEAFEAQTGKVIVKGAGQIGSMAVDQLNIAVICKESLDASTGSKQYGMAVEVVANSQRVWKMVVDYDEMDSLLNGLDYLAKLDYKVTPLPTFVASYVTKSGFRVGAFTSQRRGTIQYFLQDYSTNSARILITPAQLTQFQSLVDQTRSNLNSLRASQ